ncbi:MAG: cytochrome P450 [Acidimicrobiales bacterium]|nr:cytochrome P450 [Acidimicrobiales bacterium]
MSQGTEVGYDPFEAAVVADPYPVYRWLRDTSPLHHSPVTDTYVLSRYDDVAWAIADTDLFSSDAMLGVLLGQPTGAGPERLPREAASGNLVSLDPPAHTELRRIVNRGFTPRTINRWSPRIDELAAELLAGVEADRLDVVGQLAAPLPVRVIAELLGADAARAADFRAWADASTRAMSGSNRGGLDEGSLAAVIAMAEHLGDEIDDRQRSPRDDLLTTLVRAHGDDVLTRKEAVGFAALLLFAGTETTTNLIGNACWALLGHPDERRALAADPQRVAAVLEETLRWESPVQYVFRRATRPFARHGVEVPADATITLVLGAANRDPRHWGDDAEAFRPDRSTAGHVGFGFGAHFCLGAALARQEAAAALVALAPWLGAEQDLSGARAGDYIDSCQFRGRRRLDLVRTGR